MTCPNCARLEAAIRAKDAALRAEEELREHDADCADCDRMREEQTDCYAHTCCPESLRLGHRAYDLRKAALSPDAGKGWLPPDKVEQVGKRLLELKSRIHDRKYHVPFWEDCMVEECFAIRVALDALKRVE